MHEEAGALGHLRGLPKKTKDQFRILLLFRVTAHREVDGKPFEQLRLVELTRDSNTGKPIVLDFDLMRAIEPGMEQIIRQLSNDLPIHFTR